MALSRPGDKNAGQLSQPEGDDWLAKLWQGVASREAEAAAKESAGGGPRQPSQEMLNLETSGDLPNFRTTGQGG